MPLLGAATAPSSVVVFIHGVGVGPLPYLDLLQRLEEEGTLVVAVELPMVLQQVALRPPPSPDAFAQAFAKMLVDLSVTADVPLTLVGHSLGSAYCQYLRHRLPEAHERPVRAVALLDPIACLLNHARVTSSSGASTTICSPNNGNAAPTRMSSAWRTHSSLGQWSLACRPPP